MRRLRTRIGVPLATLGVALGALLVPIGAAPAQADHIDYDWQWWTFQKEGSWWEATTLTCFSEFYEVLSTVTITNNGNLPHEFQWVWTDYNGNPGHTSWKWVIYAHSTHTYDPGQYSYGALHQKDHPRLKIYWWNSSGDKTLLAELHAWDPPPTGNSYTDKFYGGSSSGRGCPNAGP